MSQSSYIVVALMAGFVVYLAANNRLGVYTGILWGAAQTAPSAGGGSGATSGLTSVINNGIIGSFMSGGL